MRKASDNEKFRAGIYALIAFYAKRDRSVVIDVLSNVLDEFKKKELECQRERRGRTEWRSAGTVEGHTCAAGNSGEIRADIQTNKETI